MPDGGVLPEDVPPEALPPDAEDSPDAAELLLVVCTGRTPVSSMEPVTPCGVVAVMVALPVPTTSTQPPVTAATDSSLLVHVRVLRSTEFPSSSAAESWTPFPTVTSVRDAFSVSSRGPLQTSTGTTAFTPFGAVIVSSVCPSPTGTI